MSSLPSTRSRQVPAAIAFAGVLSGFLYGSAVLRLLFLLPVQVVFGRRGWREGFAAAIVSLLASVASQLVPFMASGSLGVLVGQGGGVGSFLLLAALPPGAMLAGLLLMNAPFWRGKGRYYSGLAGAALVSLAALPGIVALLRDGYLLAQFEESLGTVRDGFLAQAGTGADSEALKASIDVKTIAQTAIMVLQCGYAAFVLAWMGASRWLGNRISGTGSLGRQEAIPLAEYRLPYLLVWPFLMAWAGVLGVSYFRVGMPWKAVAWNLALVLSLLYAVQGLGIASHLMRRWNLPKGLRVCLAVTVALVAITPPAGPVLAGLVPLLGVTETWIPYRNPKGATA